MGPLIEEERKKSIIVEASDGPINGELLACLAEAASSKQNGTNNAGGERRDGGLIEWNAEENKAICLGGLREAGEGDGVDGGGTRTRVVLGFKLRCLLLSASSATSVALLEQLGSWGDVLALHISELRRPPPPPPPTPLFVLLMLAASDGHAGGACQEAQCCWIPRREHTTAVYVSQEVCLPVRHPQRALGNWRAT